MKKLLKIAVLLVIFGGAAFFFYENKNEVAKWIEQLKPDPMRNNTYEKGQCTYYVFDKVKKDGNLISNHWGDAENWAKDAKKDGYVVNHQPAEHALMQTTKGKLGHVAYIEHVNKDGSFDGVEGLRVPKSLLYPKVKMTQAEKDEFDILQEDESVRTLSDVFCKLDELNYNGFPHLSEWFLLNPIKQTQAQIEFARAWADPSLIEVIPEKRWNVKVAPFERTKRYYYKGDKGLLGEGDSCNNQYEFQQFTADELKEYGLDDDMYEKVEVKEK